jgi:hypothetical protein
VLLKKERTAEASQDDAACKMRSDAVQSLNMEFMYLILSVWLSGCKKHEMLSWGKVRCFDSLLSDSVCNFSRERPEVPHDGTVVLQKALGRIFVMVLLCHSNDFGSL